MVLISVSVPTLRFSWLTHSQETAALPETESPSYNAIIFFRGTFFSFLFPDVLFSSSKRQTIQLLVTKLSNKSELMPIHTNIDEQYLQTSPFKTATYLEITITKKKAEDLLPLNWQKMINRKIWISGKPFYLYSWKINALKMVVLPRCLYIEWCHSIINSSFLL